MERYFGYAVDAAGTLDVAPNCTVAVYQAGTLTLATIYEDTLSTPKANPFTPDATAYFHFYAAGGRYDVRFSGPGITTAFTWADIQLIDSYQVARLDTANSFVGNQTVTGNGTFTGSLTVGGNPIINSSGKIPAISSTNFASLSGANLTSLDAGQLSTGTVPSSRIGGSYSNAVTLSNSSNVLAGASLALGALPAASGSLRLTYNEGVYSKNSSGVDTLLLKLGTSDTLEIGSATTQHMQPVVDDTYNFGAIGVRYRNGHIKDFYTSMIAFGVSLMSTSGAIRLGNDVTYAIGFRNASDSADKLFYLNGADQFAFGSSLRVTGNLLPQTDEAYDIGSTSLPWRNLDVAGTATLGIINLMSALKLQVPGGSYVSMVTADGSGRLTLGNASYGIKWGPASAAADSGTATIGSLPAGASAFYGWLPLYSSTGTQVWVPAWN